VKEEWTRILATMEGYSVRKEEQNKKGLLTVKLRGRSR
jgi:hypothetical protein